MERIYNIELIILDVFIIQFWCLRKKLYYLKYTAAFSSVIKSLGSWINSKTKNTLFHLIIFFYNMNDTFS